MELHHEKIEAAGLRILAVGLGEPKHARHFGGKLAPSVECLTNEEPTLYEAFGIEKGNMLRMLASDSRAKHSRGGVPDCLNCGVIAALLVTVWWNLPPSPDAPYHHNDGGDVFAILVLPVIWVPITGLLLMFRVGMACQPKPLEEEGFADGSSDLVR